MKMNPFALPKGPSISAVLQEQSESFSGQANSFLDEDIKRRDCLREVSLGGEMEEGLGEAGKIPILGGGGGGIALSMLVIVVNDVVVVVFAAKVGDWIGSWRRERGHCRGRP